MSRVPFPSGLTSVSTDLAIPAILLACLLGRLKEKGVISETDVKEMFTSVDSVAQVMIREMEQKRAADLLVTLRNFVLAATGIA